jgi:hypothetical protein
MLLSEIDEYIGGELTDESRNLPGDEAEAFERLAMIDEWASVASYVVGRVYSPMSPWPDLVGYGNRAIERLRKIAQKLRDLLRPIAEFFKAVSYSVAVGFPWGVTVGLSWQPQSAAQQTTHLLEEDLRLAIQRGERALYRLRAAAG